MAVRPKKITPYYLQDLLLTKLQALYDIETHLTKALPDMCEKSTDNGLSEAFQMHLDETETHVKRLEQAFSILDKPPKKLSVDAIRGLVKDAKWVIRHVEDLKARDAGIIAAALYVEHYEMAGYMAAADWAKLLGFSDIHKLLTDTLGEERMAASKLVELGNNGIFQAAVGDDTEEGNE